MTDATGTGGSRKVWRRLSGGPANTQPADDFVLCGDGEPTSREYFLQMRARRLAHVAEVERAEAEKAVEQAKEKARRDEDPDKAAERYRNDRYSVKLLRQQDNVWGGGGPDLGALG